MDFLTSLLNSMPGAAAQGLIWGIMAIGVYLTYRILDVADLTVDGSLGTGGAVCVVLVLNGVPVGAALVAATLSVPHGLRHPRNSGRYPDPAGALFGQPAHHGYRHGRRQGQPAHQRGQVRSAGFGPVCPCAGTQQSDYRAAYLLRAPHRRAVLVLRHRAWLRTACNRCQPAHGPCAGHQHQCGHRSGSDDLQRPCGAGGRPAGSVSGLL